MPPMITPARVLTRCACAGALLGLLLSGSAWARDMTGKAGFGLTASSAGPDGGVTSAFRPSYRVLVGDNRGAMAIPLGGRRFLASWTLTTTSPAAPSTGRPSAAFNTYAIDRDAWETPNAGWFATNAAPWIAPLPGGGALVFGSDGTQSSAPVVVREWLSAARPTVSRDVLMIPSGTVTSLRGDLGDDGIVQATWVESQDNGTQRVYWSAGLPVSGLADAGR